MLRLNTLTVIFTIRVLPAGRPHTVVVSLVILRWVLGPHVSTKRRKHSCSQSRLDVGRSPWAAAVASGGNISAGHFSSRQHQGMDQAVRGHANNCPVAAIVAVQQREQRHTRTGAQVGG